MLLPNLKNPVRYIKGIGHRTASILKKLNIETEGQLLLHLPREHQDRTKFSHFADSDGLNPVVVRAKIIGQKLIPIKGKGRLLKVVLFDGLYQASLVCFNRAYLRGILTEELEIVVYGVFSFLYGEWQASQFDFEILDESDKQSMSFGRFVPIYPLTEGLGQKIIRRSILSLLEKYDTFSEVLPEYLRRKRGLVSFDSALRAMHFPADETNLENARKTFSYIELFLFEMGILYRRIFRNSIRKSRTYSANGLFVKLENQFGFRLTDGQNKVIKEIYKDMLSSKPMQRLLMGDVGSGKTAVASAAVYLAVSSGYQAAIAVPTSVLANQIYRKIKLYLEGIGIKPVFLSGKTVKKERGKILEGLLTGEFNVIIGTHALFNEDVKFRELALIIIDEQHRFGVKQRRALREKGDQVDYLSMSATPIPRSLAMTAYGDFSESRIIGLPHGRKPVITRWLKGDSSKAYSCLEQQLAAGRQGFVVYPLIEETRKSDLKSAIEGFEKLKKTGFSKYGISLLHGKIKEEEKNHIMRDFIDGKTSLLVSTTVIEVGIDNPNAVVMIVEDAQRFGLSQLHQLRGRVGRGEDVSSCFLITGSRAGEETSRRLSIIERYNDGFRISEEDLKLRGPGDFFGVAQSGIPSFHYADIQRDLKTLEFARNDAIFILKRDAELLNSNNEVLRSRFQNKFLNGGYE